MGYVARSLLAPTVKKALLETIPFCMHYSKQVTGTTYGDIFKTTINFTDVDYLEFTFIGRTDASNYTVTCSIGGTTKWTDTAQADATFKQHTIDCTGITGEQAILIEIKNTNAGDKAYLSVFTMWSREA